MMNKIVKTIFIAIILTAISPWSLSAQNSSARTYVIEVSENTKRSAKMSDEKKKVITTEAPAKSLIRMKVRAEYLSNKTLKLTTDELEATVEIVPGNMAQIIIKKDGQVSAKINGQTLEVPAICKQFPGGEVELALSALDGWTVTSQSEKLGKIWQVLGLGDVTNLFQIASLPFSFAENVDTVKIPVKFDFSPTSAALIPITLTKDAGKVSATSKEGERYKIDNARPKDGLPDISLSVVGSASFTADSNLLENGTLGLQMPEKVVLDKVPSPMIEASVEGYEVVVSVQAEGG